MSRFCKSGAAIFIWRSGSNGKDGCSDLYHDLSIDGGLIFMIDFDIILIQKTRDSGP